MTGQSFDDSRQLDQWAYDLILADAPRDTNRALINSLANGSPPYTEEEALASKVKINVSDLSLTRLAHDARSQFFNAFLTPGRYFTMETDMGPVHKRSFYGGIVTKMANRPLKESLSYFEMMRSKFASLVLHGIAPAVFEDRWNPVPRAIGVEDALIPARTLLGFENLPFFMLRRSFTAMELQKLTNKTKRDPGWNMGLVNRCLKWAYDQMTQLAGNQFPEMWSPSKWEELDKENSGQFATDTVPTIDCFDIYGYVPDNGDEPAGWVRRIILDSWSNPAISGGSYAINRDDSMKDFAPAKASDFLYTSRQRKVGRSFQNIVSFQFADLSAVSPFRYHSIRSLGWMLYAVCHLQNRMRCKFNEAVFEALMMYFKVKSMDDVQRALKLELANMGFIDDTLMPVPAAERWQPNAQLIELGLQNNQAVIDNNSRAATGQPQAQQKERETNFQRMADIQQVNTLVSAAVSQAYAYQLPEYRETVRRLMLPKSKDWRALEFRANCLARGVPEKLLVPEAWDVQAERVMGSGNQTLEMLISQQLMEWRQLLDPEPQRIVLRDAIQAITKNPAKANELVPEKPEVTDSIHDAEQTFGTLMQGVQVTPKSGLNALEVAGITIKLMQQKVQQIMQSGGVGTPADVRGLATAAQYAGAYIKQLAQDETEKANATALGKVLGKVMNEVKAMAQRQQEAAKKAAAQNGNGHDPKDAAKVQAMLIQAQTKAKLAEKSHSQKTAQRQIQFEQKLKQDALKTHADVASLDLKTAGEIQRNRIKAMNEPKGDDGE